MVGIKERFVFAVFCRSHLLKRPLTYVKVDVRLEDRPLFFPDAVGDTEPRVILVTGATLADHECRSSTEACDRQLVIVRLELLRKEWSRPAVWAMCLC